MVEERRRRCDLRGVSVYVAQLRRSPPIAHPLWPFYDTQRSSATMLLLQDFVSLSLSLSRRPVRSLLHNSNPSP